MAQPWESGAADSTCAWDVYRGITSVGAAGVAALDEVRAWAVALTQIDESLSDGFYDRGINYLMTNGMVTFDGTTLTATTVVTGGTSPRALRRAANGNDLEFDPSASKPELAISPLIG